MKYPFFTTILFCLSISFTSCEKDDPDTDFTPYVSPKKTNTAGPQEFSGNYGGTVLNADQIYGYKVGDYLSIISRIGNDSLTLTAVKCDVGTYTTASNGVNSFAYYQDTATYSSTFVTNPDGIIKITDYNSSSNIISGSFSGTMRDLFTGTDIVVTNGKFKNIRLSVENAQDVGEMTATIDGSPFSAYSCFYAPNYQTTDFDLITGSNTGVSKSITIQINASLDVGTYNFNDSTKYATYFADLSSGADPMTDVYPSTSGSLTITSKNTSTKTLEGTFNFTAANFSMDTIQITNGSFRAFYQ